MRTIIALLLALTAAVAQSAAVAAAVDLNAPGELDALRERRPEHYEKVRIILSLARSRPAPVASRWIETRVGASEVELVQWRVSDPPKLRVSFTLDDVRYAAQVVPLLEPARPVPAGQ